MDYQERVALDKMPKADWADHLARYAHACQYATGRDVLDCGCGYGYGSDVLAECARTVVGIDLSAEAITSAGRRYARPNLRFQQMDSQQLEFDDAAFDVVCSFEVIEHVPDVDRYLSEIQRVLRPGGLALLSTPNQLVTSPGLAKPLNPYHLREYTPAELENLLRPHFSTVELWGGFEAEAYRKTRQQMTRWRGLLHRVDRLGLRHVVPSGLKHWVLEKIVKASGGSELDSMSELDLHFSKERIDTAPTLLALVRKTS